MPVLVTKENWPEVKKDLEAGVERIRLNDDATMIRVNSSSFVGYDIPVRFARKLAKDGELPPEVLKKIGKV